MNGVLLGFNKAMARVTMQSTIRSHTSCCSGGHLAISSSRRTKQLNEVFHMVNNELRKLPPVELSTLSLILKIVESGIANQLRITELILHDQDFFPKLMEMFRVCEDLENVDGLHLIFKIVRGMRSVLYIKREFHLQSQPTIVVIIVAMSLIGATVITTFSGPVCYYLHCSLLETLK